MRYQTLALLGACLWLLSACDSDDHSRAVYTDDLPRLQGFYVVDSDGASSEFNDGPFVLDPNTNEGLFEVYWYTQSFYDYNVYLSINDRPGLDGAEFILGDRCGIDLHCDIDGWYMCEYTADFLLSCGLDFDEIDNNFVSISELFADIPETLYLNFEVCNTRDTYCEIQTVPVLMY